MATLEENVTPGGEANKLVRAMLIMFRDFNTLELTFCVEFIIILSRVPPSLLSILPPVGPATYS